jgi:hypothetical protein
MVGHSIGSFLVWVLTLFVAVFAPTGGKAQEKTDTGRLAYKMEVALKSATDEELLLEIKLTNVSKAPITVYRDRLPWRSPNGFSLTAVHTDAAGTILRKTYPLVNPGPGKVTIQVGETLTGNVDLTRRFPTLQEERKLREEVLLFWSYRLYSAPDLTDGERKGGWVLIPGKGGK